MTVNLASDILDLAQRSRESYLADLRDLVNIDSGSHNAVGVNRVADWIVERLVKLGFEVERRSTLPVDGHQFGDVVIGRRRGLGAKKLLLFAHMDTVFADGTAAQRPFRVEGDLAYGPGVTDDKAGVTAGLHAARHLIELGVENYGELILFFTPDEEIGSPSSLDILRESAAGVDYALCLECARENGDLVSARKGAADLSLTVSGIAAHSGVEPERGAHAGLEAAHLTVWLHALADPSEGLTVNVGVLRAGDRINVIPDSAQLDVEIRATTSEALHRALDKIRDRSAAPVVNSTSISVRQVELCLPMEPNAATEGMVEAATAIARDLGFALGSAHTGGVSDANAVSATGVPTLDGVGPVGGGDHSPGEWLQLETVPQRIAMLGTLIDTLSGSTPMSAETYGVTTSVRS